MPAAIATTNHKPPPVSAQEIRRLDQWAAREYQLTPLLMAENAGRAIADLALKRFAPSRGDPILALVGRGIKGARTLAGARWILQQGYSVSAITVDVQSKDETLKELQMFRKFGGSSPPFLANKALPAASLILDGLLGYGLTDAPKGLAAQMIQAANDHAAPTLAIDLPSGLHADTGEPSETTIEAEATLALALPKEALLAPAARGHVGELYLGDVGLPRPLYAEFDVKPEELFAGALVVRWPA